MLFWRHSFAFDLDYWYYTHTHTHKHIYSHTPMNHHRSMVILMQFMDYDQRDFFLHSNHNPLYFSLITPFFFRRWNWTPYGTLLLSLDSYMYNALHKCFAMILNEIMSVNCTDVSTEKLLCSSSNSKNGKVNLMPH